MIYIYIYTKTCIRVYAVSVSRIECVSALSHSTQMHAKSLKLGQHRQVGSPEVAARRTEVPGDASIAGLRAAFAATYQGGVG